MERGSQTVAMAGALRERVRVVMGLGVVSYGGIKILIR
jgi:hypothetical protein